MKLTKEQLDKILELISESMEYEVEVNGPRDYDIHGYVPSKSIDYVWSGIQQVMAENRSELQELFDLQEQFQAKVRSTSGYGMMSWIQHVRLMFIGIITEACEALEETNWKPWKQSRPPDQNAFQKEIVDIWHFLINLTLDSGMDAQELVRRFKVKNKINSERQEERY